jgi:hypothetical protein
MSTTIYRPRPVFFIIIGFALPAFDKAIATACFCGLPSLTIERMLEDTVLSDLPDFNGILNPF